MNALTPSLSAAFRDAAKAIDPSRGVPASITPERVEAWITVESVRGQTRWLDAAVSAARPASSLAADDPSAWLHAWCLGWGSRAAPNFRKRADALADQVPPTTAGVKALLAYWRITGRRRWLDRALEGVPVHTTPGDSVAAEALRQVWRATGQDRYRQQAAASYGSPSDLSAADLPGYAEICGREMLDEDFVTGVLEDASHEVTIRAAAALGLPLLQLEVQWWLESELHEGPVAEAVTFPWPALELTFSKLQERDQVRFTPQLDGHVFETILDAGVIGAGLSEILSQADRSPFLEAAGMRRRSLRRG